MPDDKWYAARSDLYKIDPRMIVVVPGWNPRHEGNFDLGELKASIKENGVLTPLRIKRNREGHLELRDGERRYRAVMQLIEEGVPILTVPCLLEKSGTDADLLLHAMLANTGKPFTALEEAESYRRFLAWGWTIEQLAQRLGKSPQTVKGTLDLLEAAPEVVTALQNGTISKTTAAKTVRKARQTGQEQGAILEEEQGARQGKKSKKTTDKALLFALDVRALCVAESPQAVAQALLDYLYTLEDKAAQYHAVLQVILEGEPIS